MVHKDETTRSAPSRRDFLVAGAGTAAWLGMPAVVRGRNLNDRLNIACIGVGGRGASNLADVSSENIVALCDVFEPALERAGAKHPKARRVRDFRKIYDHANEFDAVVVSTTEHTHAYASLPALRLGKHVYCEKPLTHNVHEARIIREAAAKAKTATQMGTQIHAGDNYRRVVEAIRGGTIGKVSEVHTWVGRAWGRQSLEDARKHGDIVAVEERPAGSSPVPPGLDWDLWIGPAPERPFHEVYFPGPKWYRWWDFGNGTMSDLGSHWLDLPFWALDLDAPSLIEASGPPPHPELAPASMRVHYRYPAREKRAAVDVFWYQGVDKPPLWDRGEIPRWNSGVLFIGDQGMLLADYGRHLFLFGDGSNHFARPDASIPKSVGHHREWIDAAKTGGPTTCNFAYAGLLTEANHLGNVAYRTGKALEWDTKAMKATNAPEADRFLRREPRKGWSLD
ncbi:MAG: Gfo/Idh/MocA family oxidoreductase [Isosphaeraceae bacterium]|nr:Gfo/Idh/MocA family oxidoreductase [Isosphaeraceae bacterium]